MLGEEAKNLREEPRRFPPAHRRDAIPERARQDESLRTSGVADISGFQIAQIAEEFQLHFAEAASLRH